MNVCEYVVGRLVGGLIKRNIMKNVGKLISRQSSDRSRNLRALKMEATGGDTKSADIEKT